MKVFSDLMEDYIAWRRSLKLSPVTLKANRIIINVFIRWLEGSRRITTPDRLTTEFLHAWQIHLSSMTVKTGYPLNPGTINKYVCMVKGFLEYLETLGYVRKGFATGLTHVKEPRRLPGNVLTHAKMRTLLSKIPTGTPLGYRDRAMLELLYSSGIRSAELLGLDVYHVDFKNRTIMVTGKGDKERVVPFGKTSGKYLEIYIKAVRPYLLKNRSEQSLFVNTCGGRLCYRSFWKIFHAHARRSGFDNITPHTFRRTCTTELIRGGANMYHVKEFLGHESLDTLKFYTRLTINDLKKTHAKCHPRERDEE